MAQTQANRGKSEESAFTLQLMHRRICERNLMHVIPLLNQLHVCVR